MPIDFADTSSTDPVPGDSTAAYGVDAPDLRLFVFALFFVFGGITSLNDVIIPKLKELFTLSYAQVMLVQTAFFAAYFVVSIPAAAAVRRIGYLRGAALGLLVMTAGCLLFVPASYTGVFGVFLSALFVLASGITIVQVVANPLISLLGPPATAHSRLTFAQAFNSLGTTIFPYVGSLFILGTLASVDPRTLTGAALTAYRVAATHTVMGTYLALSAALAVVALIVWLRRNRLAELHAADANSLRAFDLLKQPRFGLGALSIFLYVGAEVAIGSLIVNYLMQPSVLHLSQEAAGKHIPLYWGGALLGRFLGAAILRWISPGKLWLCRLCHDRPTDDIRQQYRRSLRLVALSHRPLQLGSCFRPYFRWPAKVSGKRAAEGSGVICVAIVGGAVIPPLTGKVADVTSLFVALGVPAICYAQILAYGIYARRPRYARAHS